MIRPARDQADGFSRALRKLEQWRRFTGPAASFWPGLLDALSGLVGAQLSVLLTKSSTEKEWRRIAIWPERNTRDPGMQAFTRALDEMADAAGQQGHAVRFLGAAPELPTSDCGIALRFADEDGTSDFCVAAFYLTAVSKSHAAEMLRMLRLLQNMPAVYRLRTSVQQLQSGISQLTSVLDLMAMLDAQPRFLAVAMALCNELAARHRCDRVSLGWAGGEYLSLRAMSHTEKFERKMEAIKALEQAMEEAFDQGEIVAWPPEERSSRITREHARYADSQKVKFLCSIPLRLGGEAQGVITCERNEQPFGEDEQRVLGLCAEMAVRRLSELRQRDRWLGARMAESAREFLAALVGVRHTWSKVIAAGTALALGVLFFGGMTYRVEAPFLLRTESLAVLAAPFEGFIEEVAVRVGDPVGANDVLLRLDTSELLLQEAAAAADLDRFLREAEKAGAASALADMRIAQAQADQARARLGLIRYRVKQSSVIAGFNGVVVEGDLRQRINSPVREGDVLFKIARVDEMYVECRVPQEDVHEIRDGATGEFAFASQPTLRFPMNISQIEPVAETKDQANVFVVRCSFAGPTESWWRPGMSGVAKINVGHRTFFWILAHRTIDYLRMFFWL